MLIVLIIIADDNIIFFLKNLSWTTRGCVERTPAAEQERGGGTGGERSGVGEPRKGEKRNLND
jgi:hypothetical protein